MSDGMSDGRAVGRLADDLDLAAYELRDALKACEAGHRGLTVPGIADRVNDILKDAGFEIRRLPGR